MLEIRVGFLLHAGIEYDAVPEEIDGILSNIGGLIATT
jgi:hypothetical protein